MNIGINGVGRIGRHVLRGLITKGHSIKVINDINNDINNVLYTLKYDSIYGKSFKGFFIEGNYITNKKVYIKYSCNSKISEVDWNNVDYVIDSSGIEENAILSNELIEKEIVKKVFLTNSNKYSEFELVLGINEKNIHQSQKIISCSICDTTAIAPVINILSKNWGIKAGSITTIHPWLSYQNVLDGKSNYQSKPSQTYYNYALGRSCVNNIIPKWTSALDATDKILPGLKEKLIVFSYRTPHAIVGSADLTLHLSKSTSTESVIEKFKEFENKQKFKIIKNDYEPLVSSDYIGSSYSCHIDHRWTEVKNNMLKLVLWYDNEYGYSQRVIDQIEYYNNLKDA